MTKIAVIGGGKIGEALIGGLLSGDYDPTDIVVANRRPERSDELKERYGVTAVDDVSLDIAAGERLGIVGESGSGKSTLIRMLAGLSKPTSGEIFLDDERITGKKERELAPMRARVQVVFQDPRSSLDPRMKIRKIVTEALRSPWVKGRLGITDDPDARCAQVLEQVELDPADADKYPHEFSGGQRQRIAIARALASH
ncbi:MAG: ATP-binding cassette domain-containing protein, partial [Corynebacterium kroppenstedtii]|nr:ATP-binding cassette domain-containing protein [Corynebacterium kroppenstedtii]